MVMVIARTLIGSKNIISVLIFSQIVRISLYISDDDIPLESCWPAHDAVNVTTAAQQGDWPYSHRPLLLISIHSLLNSNTPSHGV